jgi:hypothetical protein
MSNTRDSGELSLAIASTQAGSVPTIGNNRKWGATVRTAGFDSRRPQHTPRRVCNTTTTGWNHARRRRALVLGCNSWCPQDALGYVQ